MKNSSILLLTIFASAFTSCKQDSGETTQMIQGRWEVQEASRNGRPTESLADLYFEFKPEGVLSTNVAGAPEEGTYEIKGDMVLQRNTRIDADYKIEELTEQSLVLTTELRGYAFRFAMKKDTGESTEELSQEQLQ